MYVWWIVLKNRSSTTIRTTTTATTTTTVCDNSVKTKGSISGIDENNPQFDWQASANTCNICNKEFSCLSNLQIYMRSDAEKRGEQNINGDTAQKICSGE